MIRQAYQGRLLAILTRPAAAGRPTALARLLSSRDTTGPIVTISEDESQAEVTFPGFAYDDQDRRGYVNIWKLPQLGESARRLFFGQGGSKSFANYKSLFKERYIFMASARYTPTKHFYTPWHYFNLVTYNVKLASIHNSSDQLEDTFHFGDELLSRCTIGHVFVDKETRKPTQFPDSWAAQFEHLRGKMPPFFVKPIPRPDASHTYRFKCIIAWSDTDYNYHMNQSNFIKHCHDAVSEASQSGFFSKIKGDLAMFSVQDMVMTYIGEANPGDWLDVYVWEDTANPMLIHCQMDNKDRLIYQVSFDFCPRDTDYDYNSVILTHRYKELD